MKAEKAKESHQLIVLMLNELQCLKDKNFFRNVMKTCAVFVGTKLVLV